MAPDFRAFFSFTNSKKRVEKIGGSQANAPVLWLSSQVMRGVMYWELQSFSPISVTISGIASSTGWTVASLGIT